MQRVRMCTHLTERTIYNRTYSRVVLYATLVLNIGIQCYMGALRLCMY